MPNLNVTIGRPLAASPLFNRRKRKHAKNGEKEKVIKMKNNRTTTKRSQAKTQFLGGDNEVHGKIQIEDK